MGSKTDINKNVSICFLAYIFSLQKERNEAREDSHKVYNVLELLKAKYNTLLEEKKKQAKATARRTFLSLLLSHILPTCMYIIKFPTARRNERRITNYWVQS